MRAEGSSSAAQDRRIVKTKRAVKAAFLELMEERGLDGFTVNELCEQADINRGTFYNHYCDKEAVLNELKEEFFDGLGEFENQLTKMSMTQIVLCSTTKKPLPMLVDLFDYLREQEVFLHAILGEGGDAGFGLYLRDTLFTRLIETILHERYRKSDDPFVGYYITFFASAYLGVMTKWVETGMEESSQTMARIAVRLLFIKPGESIKL